MISVKKLLARQERKRRRAKLRSRKICAERLAARQKAKRLIDVQRATFLYCDGNSVRKIAHMLGRSAPGVERVLTRAGIYTGSRRIAFNPATPANLQHTAQRTPQQQS